MIEAHATARYVRTSAQKAKLVLDLIRGQDVNAALATLRFTRKAVAHHVEKVLRSAIANAEHREGFGGDVDDLFVSECYANQGPSLKRVRPAPMGRAFRVLKRSAHLTVRVQERPTTPIAESPSEDAGGEGGAAPRRRRLPKGKQSSAQGTRAAETPEGASPASAGARTPKRAAGRSTRAVKSKAARSAAPKTKKAASKTKKAASKTKKAAPKRKKAE